jgi:hypothetical protein
MDPGRAAVSDLVEFLRARLDDREADVRRRLASDAQYGQDELDPEVLLAEVDAKRRIIGMYDERFSDDFIWQPILGALALPYAGDPAYRDEWRP